MAKHNCNSANQLMMLMVLLTEGAKVMITRNLWVCISDNCYNSNSMSGLVNGCQGTVKNIWFAPGANPQKILPSVVFVEHNGYTGESIIYI
jgi:hypothetical protein